jgi:hypothetical protein
MNHVRMYQQRPHPLFPRCGDTVRHSEAECRVGNQRGQIHDPVRGRLAVRKLLVSERESSSLPDFEAPVGANQVFGYLPAPFFCFWDLMISARRRSRVLSTATSSSRALETLSSSSSRVASGRLSGFDLAIILKSVLHPNWWSRHASGPSHSLGPQSPLRCSLLLRLHCLLKPNWSAWQSSLDSLLRTLSSGKKR